MKSVTLRIMTYNVHSCIGTDGKVSPYRIATVIAEYNPDIVALQELDAGKSRTNHSHQAEEIAEHLNMDFHFHPSIEIKEEKYGNAILSRHPLTLIQAGALPTINGWRPLEKRGALWVFIDALGKGVQIINTHFGRNRRERVLQADALIGDEWTSKPCFRPPLVVCGDFNALPVSSAYRRLRKSFFDAQHLIKGFRPLSTYPSSYPLARIDHIFTTPGVNVRKIVVPRTPMTRIASDHLPLIAEVDI